MDLWRRNPIDENPYGRTAFRRARVRRDVIQHRTLVAQISQTKRIVSSTPREHVVRGVAVTLPEVLAAEKMLLNPQERIFEELLEHAPETIPLDRIRALADEAARLLAADEPGPLPVTRPGAFRPIVAELARLFLEQSPRVTPELGSLELELLPPFGRDEDF